MTDHNQDLTTPITRQAVPERVVHRVLGLIRTGALKPGEKLPAERELANMLGVSRPSLREALRALSLLGVIDIRQGEGVFVSSLSPEALLAPLHFFISLDPPRMEALFEARQILEPGLARFAAMRINEDAIARLTACIDRAAVALNSAEDFLEADVEFHRIIMETADNPFLERVMQSLHILGRASREITVQLPGMRKQSHVDHEEILAALMKQTPSVAAEAMGRHLSNVESRYRAVKSNVREREDV